MLNEVEIKFAYIDPTQSLVESIYPEILPGDEYYEAYEINFESGQGRGVSADRQTLGETIDEIRSQIDAVVRRSRSFDVASQVIYEQIQPNCMRVELYILVAVAGGCSVR